MRYKRVVFAKPWEVEIREEETPPDRVPADSLAIKTLYTLISAGTELACLSGQEAWFPLPKTPGYASVGLVVETGTNVTGMKTGDTVFCFGPHAGYAVIPTRDPYSMVLPVPDALGHKNALFARMAGIAMTAIRASNIELGDWVAVTGAGLVGNLAAQLAELQGATAIVVDVSSGRLELARRCGLEHTVRAAGDGAGTQIRALTGDLGVSTLIEATGVPSVALDALRLIGKGGELILLGSPRGIHTGNITELLNCCHLAGRGCITFKGAHEWRYPLLRDSFLKHSIQRNIEIIFRLMEKNHLQTEPLISHVIRPEEAPSAYHGLRDDKDSYLGVVIDWT